MNKLRRIGEDEATGLSNFNGSGFEGLNMLDFGGKASSLLNDENAYQDRELVFEIKNLGVPTYDEDHGMVVSYTPASGSFDLFSGINILKNVLSFENTFSDEHIFKGVSSTGEELHVLVSSPKMFRSYIFLMLNPVKVGYIDITFDKLDQKSKSFTLSAFTPFRQTTNSRNLRFAAHRSLMQIDQLAVKIDDEFVIDSNINLNIGLVADVTMGITMYCGVNINAGKKLAKAVEAAKSLKKRIRRVK